MVTGADDANTTEAVVYLVRPFAGFEKFLPNFEEINGCVDIGIVIAATTWFCSNGRGGKSMCSQARAVGEPRVSDEYLIAFRTPVVVKRSDENNYSDTLQRMNHRSNLLGSSNTWKCQVAEDGTVFSSQLQHTHRIDKLMKWMIVTF